MRNRFHNLLLLFGPALLMLIVLLWFFTAVVHYTPQHKTYKLRDGWDITYDGVTHENESLSNLQDFLPETVKEGDVIRIERMLVMEELPSPTLGIIVYHLSVEVFLEDELIASCGMKELESGGYVGGNRYFLNLPAAFKGKRLALNYHVTENGGIPFIYSLQFGSFHDLVWEFLNEYGYVLVIGVFLILFGGFFLVFSLFFSILLPEIKGQRVSSVLCILTGIWILTHYRVYTLFTGSRNTMTVEYVSFYLVLPLLYLLVWQVHDTKKLFRICGIITFCAVMLFFVLHFTGIIYMHRLRNIYFAMCSFYLLILVWSDIMALKEKNRDPMVLLQLGGPTFFCVLVFSAMIVYLFSGGDRAEYTDFSVVLLTTGPLVFAMSRFVIYVRLLMEMAPHKLEFRSLNALAYIDGLTGLFNRTLMGELQERLDAHDHDYGLISLDLNGLKLVNDTNGHAEGDKLLRGFASVLRESFPAEASLMRIGGDEFLIIWEHAGEEHVKNCLDRMEKLFSAMDDESGIVHSAAYGYAFRHELPDTPDMHSIFLEADRRMYENKRKSPFHSEKAQA